MGAPASVASHTKATTDASQWWSDVQNTWSGHVARIREDLERKKADMDAKMARARADTAEDDAVHGRRLRRGCARGS